MVRHVRNVTYEHVILHVSFDIHYNITRNITLQPERTLATATLRNVAKQAEITLATSPTRNVTANCA